MSVTPRFVSPTNVFLPRETGQVIGFIREPGKFRLLDYVQMVKSEAEDGTGKPFAAYFILDPDEPARTGPSGGPTVTNPDIQGFYSPATDMEDRWPSGEDRPPGNILANFRWQAVQMERKNYGYDLDEQTLDTADVPLREIYNGIALQKAMTKKTQRVINMLQTSANWPTASVNDANALNGGKGKWGTASSDEASLNFAAIRLSVQQAAANIVLATNSTVRPEDLKVIISPNAALKMGATGEIYNFVKSSPFSKDRQEGRNQLNEQYGMPKFYAGVEWIVEDCSAVLEERNISGTTATTNRQFVKNDTTALMVSRKGGLDFPYGAPSFSTVQVFYWKYEMAVESYHDVWNKKHRHAVVDQYAEVLAAGRAGQLITNIL